jgi:hypothetical protein
MKTINLLFRHTTTGGRIPPERPGAGCASYGFAPKTGLARPAAGRDSYYEGFPLKHFRKPMDRKVPIFWSDLARNFEMRALCEWLPCIRKERGW